MEQIIERLRASKAQYLTSAEQAGRKEGREWASVSAEYRDLESLSALKQDFESEGSPLFVQEVVNALERSKDEIFGDGDVSFSRFSGWLRGVLEIWDEVKDKI